MPLPLGEGFLLNFLAPVLSSFHWLLGVGGDAEGVTTLKDVSDFPGVQNVIKKYIFLKNPVL